MASVAGREAVTEAGEVVAELTVHGYELRKKKGARLERMAYGFVSCVYCFLTLDSLNT